MRKLLVMSLGLIATMLFTWATPATSQTEQKAVEDALTKLLQLYNAKDQKGINDHTDAKAFKYTRCDEKGGTCKESTGAYDNKMDWGKGFTVNLGTVKVDSVTFAPNDPNTANLAAHYEVSHNEGGQAKKLTVSAKMTFAKLGGTWKLTAWSNKK